MICGVAACALRVTNAGSMEMNMSTLDRHPLAGADRAVFRQWAVGVAGFYGAMALLVVCAIAISQYVGGAPHDAKTEFVAASTLAPR